MPFSSLKSLNTINFKEMLIVALNKWYLLVLSLFLAALTSLVYTGFIARPYYDSIGKIYIQTQETVEEITSDKLSISSLLVYDFQELIRDRAVLDEVSKSLNYRYSYKKLLKCISVTNPENTRFIEITVRTTNPDDSKAIADALIDVSKEKAVEILNINQVTVLHYGTKTKSPSAPDKGMHMQISLSAGVVIFLFAIAAIYIFDDKVKDADSVQNVLGLTVLGSIPYTNSRAAAKGTKP